MEKENYYGENKVSEAESDFECIAKNMDRGIDDLVIKTEKIISCLNGIRAFHQEKRDGRENKPGGPGDKLGFFETAIGRIDLVNENLDIILGHLVKTFGQ